ncbi:vitamin K epoxide reductase family protein [Tengunoibacter tsumagoiensis]|uniref:Vitamin K epoxide reductase domain-containing protein n=1 Tax=Tengunoibacter tsumagoiensis TaxID=2014871 RepID=A0A401ZXQ9_9CHLR|nr:vitamin K epoxide reductase family protein [Tengunoibacter tsumagoiensis]GCE11629.1 hypothetical protein KTT_14880 [Tengunoibacter tsumagoiensis]
MEYFQRKGGQILLLVLSLIGVGISIYLTVIHYNHAPVVCSASGVVNCELVLSSTYSSVPGTTIPISIPGLLWTLVGAGLAVAALVLGPARKWVRIAEVAWTGLGMLTVFYLVYAELVRLHAICAWCTGLHVIIFIMFLSSILLLQGPEQDEEEYDLEEEEEPLAAH